MSCTSRSWLRQFGLASNGPVRGSRPQRTSVLGQRYGMRCASTNTAYPQWRGKGQDESKINVRDQSLHEKQQLVESLISALPLTRHLRSASQPAYQEMRLSDSMYPSARPNHLVGSALLGENKLPIEPYLFFESQPSSRVIALCYMGANLCGHPGYVHGGLPFILYDDIFARCAARAFGSSVAMTANMNIDFRKPCFPDRVYTVRAEITKMEGRKAWLSGTTRCLNDFTAEQMANKASKFGTGLSPEEEEAEIVAEGSALFIRPKFESEMTPLFKF